MKRILKYATFSAACICLSMPCISHAAWNDAASTAAMAQAQGAPATRAGSEAPASLEGGGSAWAEGFEDMDGADVLGLLKGEAPEAAVMDVGTRDLYLTFAPEKEGGPRRFFHVEDPDGNVAATLAATGVEVASVSLPGKQPEGGGSPGNFFASHPTASTAAACLFIFGIPVLFWYVSARREKKKVTSGAASGKPVPGAEEAPKVRFSDVEGVEELKPDILRLVDCLKHPEKYRALGARTPKGVILYGPPGTGKTLLAKAVAGEAGVPFFSAVGSDFVEQYVGTGAKRVRELYKKAKAKAPCIVFIDEVDAVAGSRSSRDGGDSERCQTVNALLAELDGFDGSRKPVITICATNRLDMLDSAFKRAGRFDLKLAVALPDKAARLSILTVHARNKKLSDGVTLPAIAERTSGFSGAELEALLNEAAMLAAGKGQAFIRPEDMDDAYFKVVMQGNKKRRTGISETNRMVAWHESGHTLATYLFTKDRVSTVTVIGSTSGAGGVTMRDASEEGLSSRASLEGSIKVMYAGRAAEELYFKDPEKITTGASQDIRQATGLIRDYVQAYGFGSFGMLDMSQFDGMKGDVAKESSALAVRLYQETLDGLKAHEKALGTLAGKLLDMESLDRASIEEILGGCGIEVGNRGAA